MAAKRALSLATILALALTAGACKRGEESGQDELGEAEVTTDESAAESESAGAEASESAESGSDEGSSSSDSSTDTDTDTGEPFDPTPTDVLAATGCDAPIPEASDARWQAFLDQREAWLYALSEPILDCVDNQDTDHPAFHGCIDWHSSVHATWALHALYRITGEPAYLAAADAVLDPEGVAGELEDLSQNDLPFVEVLYGRAWFLLLARERELATEGRAMELRPHAELAADQLEDFIAGLSQSGLASQAVADDYFNLSWALINLHRWAVHVGDAARVEWVEMLASEVLMPADCPLVDAVGFAEDFFPPCLHRAHGVLEILPPAQTEAWLADALPGPDEFPLMPLCEPAPAHVAGLNFSRAWGLWSLWTHSQDPRYRDLYVEHVWRHMAQPDYWAEDYWAHSHWIAQFGVQAIWLSYGYE